MSFLDNLENNLKALESREEAVSGDSRRRDKERDLAVAAAPWAERLKKEPYAQNLIQQAVRAGHQRRTKVNLTWIDTTLRLEARGRRLELRPGSTGITAVFARGMDDFRQEPVDLASDPQKLVVAWMAEVDEQKRLDEEQVVQLPEEELE